METVYAHGTPIASCLEGDGTLDYFTANQSLDSSDNSHDSPTPFASSNTSNTTVRRRKRFLTPLRTISRPPQALREIHDAWSTAVNSRLGRSANGRFLEHFRYILVASQLLNEFLDQGALQPQEPVEITDKKERTRAGLAQSATSPTGVAVVAIGAFACASLLHWIRVSGLISRRRALLAFTIYAVLAFVGYIYCRTQFLWYIRRRAIEIASSLTTSWQSFEVSSSSALSLIQEVELVSKGYRLSTPLPPVSRLEDTTGRRCARLRKTLCTAYTTVIPACTETVRLLRSYVDDDDLDKYYEVYDISIQDVNDALSADALTVIDDDAESLKSLRVLSYRAGVLRRVVLCHLMSLPADGGKPDLKRWRKGLDAMSALVQQVAQVTEKLNQVLSDMETLPVPTTPASKLSHTPTREKMRSQVRKISTLSTGIRSLQAKMQILREETSRSIERSDDLTDLGPDLMAQYESIGTDITELMQAWEQGKASLQSNITKKEEKRISMASSGLRSPVSSIGGLTAVDEDSTPADALRALTGDLLSDTSSRSSIVLPSPSEEEVFEAIAIPKVRSTLTREERIAKMHEERERQASLRSTRDANTSMLKELESVINLRPRNSLSAPRMTSM